MALIVKLRSLASGKKTYVVALLMIALGIMNGDNQMVLEGIGFLTLRAGISKSGPVQQ